MSLADNRQGKRERTWVDMTSGVGKKGFDGDWSLPGPRTALWCSEYINKQGVGLNGHHDRSVSVCKLDAGSWGVAEHFNLTQALEYGVCSRTRSTAPTC